MKGALTGGALDTRQAQVSPRSGGQTWRHQAVTRSRKEEEIVSAQHTSDPSTPIHEHNSHVQNLSIKKAMEMKLALPDGENNG